MFLRWRHLVLAVMLCAAVAYGVKAFEKFEKQAKLNRTLVRELAVEDDPATAEWASVTNVAALVAEGADVTAKTPGDKLTALHVASRSSDLDLVRALIEKGAEVNAATRRTDATPLIFALEMDRLTTAACLTAAGANVNRPDRKGITPLMFAAARGTPESIGWLIARGAELERPDPKGRTPLMFAVGAGLVENTRALLAAGAKREHRDQQGATARELARLQCSKLIRKYRHRAKRYLLVMRVLDARSGETSAIER